MLLQRTLPSREKECLLDPLLPQQPHHVGIIRLMCHLKTLGSESFKCSGTKLEKCRAGTQTKILWPHHQWQREEEEWGGSQCFSKVPWCPLRQTALLLVKPDERWMLVMLWIKVQLPSSPLLLPLSCFLMHKQSYSPGWHHLHQLSSCLYQCQGQGSSVPKTTV